MNTNEALAKIAKLAIGTKEVADHMGGGIQYIFNTEAIAEHALGLAFDYKLNVQGGAPKSFIIWSI